MEIKIPHLGDGIDSATVLSVMVNVGDSVAVEDTLLELETDKAVAPVPSTAAGTIEAIHVAEGDTVTTAQLVATLSGASGESTEAPQETPVAPVAPAPVAPPVAPLAPLAAAPVQAVSNEVVVTSPWLRKLATQIGLDLTRIAPTGSGGRVTLDDVRGYVATLQAGAFAATPAAVPAPEAKPKTPLPDFSKWGEVEVQKLSSLRLKIGEKMSESWADVPHVTQFDDANISALMVNRKKYNPKYKEKGVNLTLTAMAVKVAVDALKEFPNFNASFDSEKGELVVKKYYHIGVAVDTPNGLIVPVIRNADQKPLFEIAKEIGELAEKARDRKIAVEELQGGTFTISNLGGLGVGNFTPIVNTPEVAILGLGRGNLKPIIVDKKIDQGIIQPLGLSYDHRIIDGADGARFMRKLVDGFENFKAEWMAEI